MEVRECPVGPRAAQHEVVTQSTIHDMSGSVISIHFSLSSSVQVAWCAEAYVVQYKHACCNNSETFNYC